MTSADDDIQQLLNAWRELRRRCLIDDRLPWVSLHQSDDAELIADLEHIECWPMSVEETRLEAMGRLWQRQSQRPATTTSWRCPSRALR